MSTTLKASHNTFDGMKEKLVKDLKSVVADADELLKEVASSSVEEFAAARSKLAGRLVTAKARLDGARSAVAETAQGAVEATHEYARENPAKLVGIAALAGLVIGYLLSRR